MSRLFLLLTSLGVQAAALLISMTLLYLGSFIFFQSLLMVDVMSHVFSAILVLLMLPTLHQGLHEMLVAKPLARWKSTRNTRTTS